MRNGTLYLKGWAISVNSSYKRSPDTSSIMKLFIDSTFGPPPLQMEFCDYGSLAAAIKRGVFTPDNSGHEPWMNLKALIATVTEMAQVREGGRGREREGGRKARERGR